MQAEYDRFKARWLAGERNTALACRLMFHAWMHWADPSFITGLSDDPEAVDIWLGAFESERGESSTSAEFLYVAGLMARLFPWMLGDVQTWEVLGLRMQARGQSQLGLRTFDGDTEYDRYFTHQFGP